MGSSRQMLRSFSRWETQNLPARRSRAVRTSSYSRTLTPATSHINSPNVSPAERRLVPSSKASTAHATTFPAAAKSRISSMRSLLQPYSRRQEREINFSVIVLSVPNRTVDRPSRRSPVHSFRDAAEDRHFQIRASQSPYIRGDGFQNHCSLDKPVRRLERS